MPETNSLREYVEYEMPLDHASKVFALRFGMGYMRDKGHIMVGSLMSGKSMERVVGVMRGKSSQVAMIEELRERGFNSVATDVTTASILITAIPWERRGSEKLWRQLIPTWHFTFVPPSIDLETENLSLKNEPTRFYLPTAMGYSQKVS